MALYPSLCNFIVSILTSYNRVSSLIDREGVQVLIHTKLGALIARLGTTNPRGRSHAAYLKGHAPLGEKTESYALSAATLH